MSTEKLSKRLSYLLRHKPEAANLSIDKEGWVPLDELVVNAGFTLTEIHEIVRADEKTRYTIKDDKIRANQGHSTAEVKLVHVKKIPPVELYHGTQQANLKSIYKKGLVPAARHHVHLSSDLQTAESVGGRRKGELVVLRINTKPMVAAGIPFYLSENGVWLVDQVLPEYLSKE